MFGILYEKLFSSLRFTKLYVLIVNEINMQREQSHGWTTFLVIICNSEID
jgi:hypothetical protein